MEKLLWIDMEMSGLDVNKEVIIEAAAIVTDYQLKELDTYHAVVKQPQKYIDSMDAWNKQTHGASGLTALIPTGREPEAVEADLLKLMNRHFAEAAVLAGNSIGQD